MRAIGSPAFLFFFCRDSSLNRSVFCERQQYMPTSSLSLSLSLSLSQVWPPNPYSNQHTACTVACTHVNHNLNLWKPSHPSTSTPENLRRCKATSELCLSIVWFPSYGIVGMLQSCLHHGPKTVRLIQGRDSRRCSSRPSAVNRDTQVGTFYLNVKSVHTTPPWRPAAVLDE